MAATFELIQSLPWEVLAERDIECTFPDGTRKLVTLKLGRPQPAPDADWLCFVNADGLPQWTEPKVLFGVDPWQAMFLAAGLLFRVFHHYVKQHGIALYWNGTKEPMTFEEALSFPWMSNGES